MGEYVGLIMRRRLRIGDWAEENRGAVVAENRGEQKWRRGGGG
jgi:hypothetical protein